MSNPWKNKVLPKIKKLFDKGKKTGAAQACKAFDKSRESLDKEFVEKAADLSPKVVEVYRSSSTFTAKQLLKKPSEADVKENPAVVEGVLKDLVEAGFPGAQVISDAGKKFGLANLPGPVVYLLEKASVYLTGEPLPEEPREEKSRKMTVEDIKAATTTAAEPETSVASATSEAESSAATPSVEGKKEEVLEGVAVPNPPVPAPVTESAAAMATSMPPAPAATETAPRADKTD